MGFPSEKKLKEMRSKLDKAEPSKRLLLDPKIKVDVA